MLVLFGLWQSNCPVSTASKLLRTSRSLAWHCSRKASIILVVTRASRRKRSNRPKTSELADLSTQRLALTAFPNHLDSTVIYAIHPFISAWQDEATHHQIFDKAFEDRACKALERHLEFRVDIRRRISSDPARQDGWRILTVKDNRDVAEWEGIWKGPDGCKFPSCSYLQFTGQNSQY